MEAVGPVIACKVLHLLKISEGLSDQKAAVVLVHQGTELSGKGDGLREVFDHLGRAEEFVVLLPVGKELEGEGIVPELLILIDGADDIKAEAVHSLVEPEPENVKHLLLHLGVPVVQIRLEGEECRPVPLVCLFVILPAAALNLAEPVIGGLVSALAVLPDIPVPFRVVL